MQKAGQADQVGTGVYTPRKDMFNLACVNKYSMPSKSQLPTTLRVCGL